MSEMNNRAMGILPLLRSEAIASSTGQPSATAFRMSFPTIISKHQISEYVCDLYAQQQPISSKMAPGIVLRNSKT